mmetsp:Transcript_4114/g.8335  ORF Transcript_4114/g.8335 Transcript_4114/m.8335 type:complete len:283 (-) Transcript_4114:1447-2295(-)|eukprot:scaffold5783_cov129-Amphora_coffeaeformis.AAC.14
MNNNTPTSTPLPCTIITKDEKRRLVRKFRHTVQEALEITTATAGAARLTIPKEMAQLYYGTVERGTPTTLSTAVELLVGQVTELMALWDKRGNETNLQVLKTEAVIEEEEEEESDRSSDGTLSSLSSCSEGKQGGCFAAGASRRIQVQDLASALRKRARAVRALSTTITVTKTTTTAKAKYRTDSLSTAITVFSSQELESDDDRTSISDRSDISRSTNEDCYDNDDDWVLSGTRIVLGDDYDPNDSTTNDYTSVTASDCASALLTEHWDDWSSISHVPLLRK